MRLKTILKIKDTS